MSLIFKQLSIDVIFSPKFSGALSCYSRQSLKDDTCSERPVTVAISNVHFIVMVTRYATERNIASNCEMSQGSVHHIVYRRSCNANDVNLFGTKISEIWSETRDQAQSCSIRLFPKLKMAIYNAHFQSNDDIVHS